MDCAAVNSIGVKCRPSISTHLRARCDTILSDKHLKGYSRFLPDAFVHCPAADIQRSDKMAGSEAHAQAARPNLLTKFYLVRCDRPICEFYLTSTGRGE